MSNISLSPQETAWDAFLATHPQAHILQTARWARLKAAFGWRTLHVPLRNETRPGNLPVGGANILLRRLPWGQEMAYVPRGPVVAWNDRGQTETLMAALRDVCRKRGAALLKIEPELPDTAEVSELLTGLGFRRSPQRIQPISTIHVDLAADEATILARMKQKWRYNIRLAERKGVTVREGGAHDLPAIQDLMEATGRRDGFGVHNLAYHTAATRLFQPAGLMTWLIAEHTDQMLAAIAVFTLGKMAWYMWGASADTGRNLMPNHAVQWAAMRWAKARGCTTYDLWGIPDEVEAGSRAEAEGEGGSPAQPDRSAAEDAALSQDDGLWGVYRFKQGFGGEVVRYTGAWDWPASKAGYTLYRLALRVRRWQRR